MLVFSLSSLFIIQVWFYYVPFTYSFRNIVPYLLARSRIQLVAFKAAGKLPVSSMHILELLVLSKCTYVCPNWVSTACQWSNVRRQLLELKLCRSILLQIWVTEHHFNEAVLIQYSTKFNFMIYGGFLDYLALVSSFSLLMYHRIICEHGNVS